MDARLSGSERRTGDKMRQLTMDEKKQLFIKYNSTIHNKPSFEAGFVAGLECQDKRIEALVNMLKAAGVSENIINGVLVEVVK